MEKQKPEEEKESVKCFEKFALKCLQIRKN